MAEKMSEVFEMYDVRLDHIGRGRGAMLLQTDKGVRQIRATTAGEKRLQAEYDFKEHMYLAGFPHIDRLVKNVEDELITYDRYGNPFVMRMFLTVVRWVSATKMKSCLRLIIWLPCIGLDVRSGRKLIAICRSGRRMMSSVGTGK